MCGLHIIIEIWLQTSTKTSLWLCSKLWRIHSTIFSCLVQSIQASRDLYNLELLRWKLPLRRKNCHWEGSSCFCLGHRSSLLLTSNDAHKNMLVLVAIEPDFEIVKEKCHNCQRKRHTFCPAVGRTVIIAMVMVTWLEKLLPSLLFSARHQVQCRARYCLSDLRGTF